MSNTLRHAFAKGLFGKAVDTRFVPSASPSIIAIIIVAMWWCCWSVRLLLCAAAGNIVMAPVGGEREHVRFGSKCTGSVRLFRCRFRFQVERVLLSYSHRYRSENIYES